MTPRQVAPCRPPPSGFCVFFVVFDFFIGVSVLFFFWRKVISLYFFLGDTPFLYEAPFFSSPDRWNQPRFFLIFLFTPPLLHTPPSPALPGRATRQDQKTEKSLWKKKENAFSFSFPAIYPNTPVSHVVFELHTTSQHTILATPCHPSRLRLSSRCLLFDTPGAPFVPAWAVCFPFSRPLTE